MQNIRHFLLSSASLMLSQVITAGVGFVFWVVASRLFDQASVGLVAAIVSGLSLVGTLGALGLGTLLIYELPRRPHERLGLVVASIIAATLTGGAFGVAFAVVAPALSAEFDALADPLLIVIVAVGAGVT